MKKQLIISLLVTMIFVAVLFLGNFFSWQVIAQTSNANSTRSTVFQTLFAKGSWSIPAKDIPSNSDQHWVAYLYNNGTAARPGNFNTSINTYTYPVYIANSSTPRYPVVSENPDWGRIHGKTMPYDSSWKASQGEDAQLIVIDPTTKTYYEVWQFAGLKNGSLHVSNGSIIENYDQSNGINGPSRGSGIAYFAMLVTPEEVEAGKIAHAISMTTKNTGPTYVAPAVKSDGATFGVASGIPMGTRFALTMTNEELDQWILSKPANLQKLARALGYALRDYGYIITDSSGGASIQLEDVASAHDKWKSITGINDLTYDPNNEEKLAEIRDLLDGLAWNKARVLAPTNALAQTTNTQATGTPNSTISPTPTLIPSSTPSPVPSRTPTATASPTPSDNVKPLTKRADVNKDGKINLDDLQIIILNFRKKPLINPRADINRDGRVNIIDLRRFFRAFQATL